jgi:hypothetical protein
MQVIADEMYRWFALVAFVRCGGCGEGVRVGCGWFEDVSHWWLWCCRADLVLNSDLHSRLRTWW